jgi:hypothetical protein
MSTWAYIDPFCGSGAVPLALLGYSEPIVPYQGSKWKWRRELLALFAHVGFSGLPRTLWLNDIGPWGCTLPYLLKGKWHEVAGELTVCAALRPGESTLGDRYRTIVSQPVPGTDAQRAARHLFLQRLSFSGKPVGWRKRGRGRSWITHGFNPTSAYGKPKTGRFGAIRPQVPALVQRLQRLGWEQPRPETAACVPRFGAALAKEWLSGLASGWTPFAESQDFSRVLLYLDPPYAGTTGYCPDDPALAEVDHLARTWAEYGATVVVSGPAIPSSLLSSSWHSEPLNERRRGESPFKSTSTEWVTYYVPPSRKA